MLHVVNGDKKNTPASTSFERNLLELYENYTGTVYHGFALSEIDNTKIIIDALIVTKEKGILAINFSSFNEDQDIEKMDRIYVLLRALLEKNSRLRSRRNLAIEINVINYVPSKEEIPSSFEEDYISEETFLEYYTNDLPNFNDRYFEALNEALDKVVSAKPKKPRSSVTKPSSLGAKIKQIELSIANMDKWQRTAAYEIPNKPQRIRGLAGSGKTIVLALKAAYLHFKDPTADIAVTFYSRSLYQQFTSLIQEFYQQYSNDKVDFEKVHILHAWGTLNEPGIYSKAARELKADVFTFKQAESAFGKQNSFKGICEILVDKMKLNNIDKIPMYDYILIDEAQDMPPTFFQLAYKLFKSDEKRIVYAYDELQNLSKSSMPSTKEMFGVDSNGNPLVSISNNLDDPSQPRTDIVLPICYRNSKWTLTIAHALGFGVYRNATPPLVQFFKQLNVWEEIGYEVIEGTLNFNEFVKLKRNNTSSPAYFEELMSPEDAITVLPAFNSKQEEYYWVAQQIKKNITEDELDPDDILVIFPDSLTSFSNYDMFNLILRNVGVDSIMPGKNVDRDTFTVKGKITCTHIYRAKGNERPMVYILDGEYGNRNIDLINVRNTLFTAITRSRAWVRIVGTGSGMTELASEIKKCVDMNYTLAINIPTSDEISKINLLNRDASEEEMKRISKVEKVTGELIEMIQKGIINADDIPKLKDLANLVEIDPED
ncbi:RNA helicase [Bacillus cereus]|uniref:RNA helicase n=1 Tax=Bacillus cereus TaxID=1396 RepID=A0A2B3TS85_BACCE|nr:ATP-binding domain-containing protein [Bacillus cereus]PFU37415.1 RNA helicase [Bacillus cereus]